MQKLSNDRNELILNHGHKGHNDQGMEWIIHCHATQIHQTKHF